MNPANAVNVKRGINRNPTLNFTEGLRGIGIGMVWISREADRMLPGNANTQCAVYDLFRPVRDRPRPNFARRRV